MQVGDLVWVVCRPRDSIPKHLAIIVDIRQDGYFVVSPMYNMDRRNLFMAYELKPFEKRSTFSLTEETQ